MGKNYWLHRINHETELSYPLLHAGYLSYGWQTLSLSDLHKQVEEAKTEKEKWDKFNAAMLNKGETSRSRFSLWRFFNFDNGDIVIVPRQKAFDVFQVKGNAFTVSELTSKPYPAGLPETVEITGEGLRNKQTERIYDIGYLIEVEPVKLNIPRSFAPASLVSRMKTRQTNVRINDLQAEIKFALDAEKEVSIHDVALGNICDTMKQIILTHLIPKQLEQLVGWYFEKKGASRVVIPPKNESWKKDGADADVIAEFEDLRIIFYVQVKEHVGETDGWGVTQIKEYGDQMQTRNGYTYVPWVLSTAAFTEDAENQANDAGVRLITGDEFMAMLLDCGIDTIDQALEKSYPTK